MVPPVGEISVSRLAKLPRYWRARPAILTNQHRPIFGVSRYRSFGCREVSGLFNIYPLGTCGIWYAINTVAGSSHVTGVLCLTNIGPGISRGGIRKSGRPCNTLFVHGTTPKNQVLGPDNQPILNLAHPPRWIWILCLDRHFPLSTPM